MKIYQYLQPLFSDFSDDVSTTTVVTDNAFPSLEIPVLLSFDNFSWHV